MRSRMFGGSEWSHARMRMCIYRMWLYISPVRQLGLRSGRLPVLQG
jgi:hypothetical protein